MPYRPAARRDGGNHGVQPRDRWARLDHGRGIERLLPERFLSLQRPATRRIVHDRKALRSSKAGVHVGNKRDATPVEDRSADRCDLRLCAENCQSASALDPTEPNILKNVAPRSASRSHADLGAGPEVMPAASVNLRKGQRVVIPPRVGAAPRPIIPRLAFIVQRNRSDTLSPPEAGCCCPAIRLLHAT